MPVDPFPLSGDATSPASRPFAAADDAGPCNCPLCTGAVTVSEADGATGQSYLNADQRAGAVVNGKESFTIDRAGLQLTGFDAQTMAPAPGWGGIAGRAFTVTYAFRSTEPASMPSDTTGFQRFNTQQIYQAEQAMQAWADVANIRFVRVGIGTSGEGAYSNDASILFGNYSSGKAARPPSPTTPEAPISVVPPATSGSTSRREPTACRAWATTAPRC